ncbi:MAG: dihydroneopterin aldolase [Candidatus Kapabacteria bacterium]|nr:dihydroneopterin aldolase [Candidatus Kapabacteria bacterium]
MARHESLTRISIVNAEFFAYHGVRADEKSLGGRFQIDVDLLYSATSAVVSDNINDTINYEEVLYLVNEIMSGEPYDLIETLAYDIANGLLERFAIARQATTRVRKLNVPIQQVMDYVEAEYTAIHENA